MICRRPRRITLPRIVSLAVLAGAVILTAYSAQQKASDWLSVAVPDIWKNPPTGKLASRDGYSWYRCLVQVPTSWEGKQVELFVEPVDDARAVYVNGDLVGTAGTFPPRYRSGLAEPSRHRVPKKLVRFGAWNIVA